MLKHTFFFLLLNEFAYESLAKVSPVPVRSEGDVVTLLLKKRYEIRAGTLV